MTPGGPSRIWAVFLWGERMAVAMPVVVEEEFCQGDRWWRESGDRESGGRRRRGFSGVWSGGEGLRPWIRVRKRVRKRARASLPPGRGGEGDEKGRMRAYPGFL